MPRTKLTAGRIDAHRCPESAAQAFLWDSEAPGLAVRATRGDGVKAFVFQSRFNGRALRITIGDVRAWPIESSDPAHPGARQEARRLQSLIDRGIDPRAERAERLAAAEAKRTEREAAAEAEQRRIAAAEAAQRYSLQALFDAYVAHLRKQGKSAAYDAGNLFHNHVATACAELAQKPANAIKPREIVAPLRTLTGAGKGRTAAKLRSYLRAAYAIAARAATDPDAPAAFLAFNVETNPVQDTGALSKYNVARDRALSEPELRAFWQAVKAAPTDAAHDALRLLLLLGGQRPAQLVRAVVGDVDESAGTITLRDPKGKRPQPRIHAVPLTDAALVVVKRCIARANAQREKRGDHGPRWLLSSHGGAPLRPETVTQACNDIAAGLLAIPQSERVVQEPFQLRDIRRTCETRLAALGISKDVRAQLQSHGLGGVQARHYDRHDYAAEKRAALVAWGAHIETQPAGNVRPIRRRKQA